MSKVRVLLADDHTLFRKGVRAMLEAEEDMCVVGEAASGDEAVTQARALMPDVVLMDIRMPGLDGVEATRILHRELPHLGIVFCTMLDEDAFVFAGLKAGGRGYILKDAEPKTMLRAVRAIAQGESLLSPAVANKVLRQFAALPGEEPAGRSPLCDDLTEREREVLGLIGRGLSNREIAGQLCISDKTVKNHIANIFAKLHVNDRTQAVLYAIRKGLVKV